MTFKLPDLDFSSDALVPFLSAETLEFHHGKHHAGYVKKLVDGLGGSGLEGKSLVDLVKSAEGGLFDNAGQHFNHSFYWKTIAPGGASEPQGALAEAVRRDFGSFSDLRERFEREAVTHFGSGWCWLVKTDDGKLEVLGTHDAGNPLTAGHTPLVTCDVWEHAYYIDYRNARPKYVQAFWKAVDWDFAGRCFDDPGTLERIGS